MIARHEDDDDYDLRVSGVGSKCNFGVFLLGTARGLSSTFSSVMMTEVAG